MSADRIDALRQAIAASPENAGSAVPVLCESFASFARLRPPIAWNTPPAKMAPAASVASESTPSSEFGFHASSAPAGVIFASRLRVCPQTFPKKPPA